jgi:hypothetical protein
MGTEDELLYPVENGVVLVELAIKRVEQLFNTLDPAPFHEKDMDDDAEEYIFEAVEEISLAKPVRLVIYMPPESVSPGKQLVVREAIEHYFRYRAEITRRQLHHIFWQGRVSLAIGIAFLFICFGIQRLFDTSLPDTFWSSMLREGLMIGGWVALWKPIQIFLYDWWPIRHRMMTYRKISAMEVDIRARKP